MFDNKILHYTSTIYDGNIAYHVGDDPKNVDANRKKLAQKIDNSRFVYMEQAHGKKVAVVDRNTPLHVKYYDALVTQDSNIPLMVMVADCIAISFYDKVQGVIAVAHAGRNGTFLNISKNVINTMKESFTCKAENIEVFMSPSIQKCCYEVDEQMCEIAKENFGEEFVYGRNLDLQGINKKQLLECGCKEENITISHTCTKCSNEPYYSYRKDKECGRFCSIMLKYGY
jgi:YfiH family protein